MKKFHDGDRSVRLYITISLQLRRFSKIATIVYQKDSCSFYCWVHQEAKRSILQDYELTDRHTHTQTDCYNPPPTLGLIFHSIRGAGGYIHSLMMISLALVGIIQFNPLSQHIIYIDIGSFSTN